MWRIKEDPSLWRRYRDDGLGLAAILSAHLATIARAGRGKAAPAPAESVARRVGGTTFIALSGDLVADGRAPLRKAFRQAAAEGRDVALDLRDAGRLDASFFGLVLMLEKNLRSKGAVIRLAHVTRAQRRLFSANAMDYEDAPAIGAEADRGSIAAAV